MSNLANKLAHDRVLDIKWQVLIGLLVSLAFYAMKSFSLFDVLESRVTIPVLYQVRTALGHQPSLAESLKIYNFDDSSVGKVKNTRPTAAQWSTILEKLAERQPDAIYIDKFFALEGSADPSQANPLKELAKFDVPIVTVAFVSPRAIDYLDPLDVERISNRSSLINSPPMREFVGWKAYGPSNNLKQTFRYTGHSQAPIFNRVPAYIRLAKDKYLGHFTLLGSEEVTFKTRKIYVGGSELPVNSAGEILVNYSNPMDYYKKSLKFGGLLAKAERGESFDSIEAGDTVLILSSMYTGAAKFIPTPVGQLPSAYINATLLSSRIEGNWLSTHELRMPYILIGAFFALLLMRLSGVLLWAVSGGIMVVWTVSVSYFFVFHSVLIDLMSPVLTYTTTAFVAFMFKSHVYEKVSLFFKIVLAEKARLQFEVDQADGIAKGFRPLPPPKFEGIEISYTHRSLSASSGDWFAFEKSKSGRYLHFIMCDVTGHGLQASIVVSTCKATLTIVSNAFQDLTEGFEFLPTYIEHLNLALFKGGAGLHVTTLTAITFDRDTNHTKYYTAGHPNPFHLLPKDDGLKFGKISSASNPLGLRSKVETEGMDVFFRPGESLVFFTDGVPFPRNAKKNPDLFDSKFATDLPSRVQNVLDHLLIEHSKKTGVGQDDDISLVWFQREPRKVDAEEERDDKAIAL